MNWRYATEMELVDEILREKEKKSGPLVIRKATEFGAAWYWVVDTASDRIIAGYRDRNDAEAFVNSAQFR